MMLLRCALCTGFPYETVPGDEGMDLMKKHLLEKHGESYD